MSGVHCSCVSALLPLCNSYICLSVYLSVCLSFCLSLFLSVIYMSFPIPLACLYPSIVKSCAYMVCYGPLGFKAWYKEPFSEPFQYRIGFSVSFIIAAGRSVLLRLKSGQRFQENKPFRSEWYPLDKNIELLMLLLKIHVKQ